MPFGRLSRLLLARVRSTFRPQGLPRSRPALWGSSSAYHSSQSFFSGETIRKPCFSRNRTVPAALAQVPTRRGPVGLLLKMNEQLSSYALAGGADVGVSDEDDVLDVLDAHDSGQGAVVFLVPEDATVLDLTPGILLGHVEGLPATGGLSGGRDDGGRALL